MLLHLLLLLLLHKHLLLLLPQPLLLLLLKILLLFLRSPLMEPPLPLLFFPLTLPLDFELPLCRPPLLLCLVGKSCAPLHLHAAWHGEQQLAELGADAPSGRLVVGAPLAQLVGHHRRGGSAPRRDRRCRCSRGVGRSKRGFHGKDEGRVVCAR